MNSCFHEFDSDAPENASAWVWALAACVRAKEKTCALWSRHAWLCCRCTHAFLYSAAHVFVLRGPASMGAHAARKGHYFDFGGERANERAGLWC